MISITSIAKQVLIAIVNRMPNPKKPIVHAGESQWELPDGVLAGEVRHSAVELEGYVWSYVESPRMRSAGDEIDNETINQLKMLKDQVGARINDIR